MVRVGIGMFAAGCLMPDAFVSDQEEVTVKMFLEFARLII